MGRRAKIVYKALVVEGNAAAARVLCESLEDLGFVTRHAATGQEALGRYLRAETYHVVFCDLELPGDMNGLMVLRRLHETCPATRTVMLADQQTPTRMATAYRRGAIELLLMPPRLYELKRLVAKVKEEAPLFLPNLLLAEPCGHTEFEGLLTLEEPMLAVLHTLREAAALDHPVLITGEPGVGKASLAGALHKLSDVAGGPFVVLKTAAYPTRQLGRALFGRERDAAEGAGEEAGPTGAIQRATDGTLYIDDLTHLDTPTQARLLSFIETGRYSRIGGERERRTHVRIVASAPMPIDALPAEDAIGRSLYDRLRGCAVHVPPLRERRRDIPLLANHILLELARTGPSRATQLSAEAERMLCNYAWPGNVRELESTIRLASFGVRSAVVQGYQLPAAIRGAAERPQMLSIPYGSTLADVEREAILQTLRLSNGNKSQAAEVLGISRRTLYDKLLAYQRQLGLDLLGKGDDKGRPGRRRRNLQDHDDTVPAPEEAEEDDDEIPGSDFASL